MLQALEKKISIPRTRFSTDPGEGSGLCGTYSANLNKAKGLKHSRLEAYWEQAETESEEMAQLSVYLP